MVILRKGRGNGCSNAGSEQKLASALPQACSCTSRLLTAVALPGKGMDLAKNWVSFKVELILKISPKIVSALAQALSKNGPQTFCSFYYI